MSTFDSNKDGKISMVEFLEMVKKIGLYKEREDLVENDEEKENIICAFVALGGNSDLTGTVSCSKLKNMVDVFDLDLDTDALLKILDEDENGSITYLEFSCLFGTRKVNESMV